ncbi:universal stress protein [Nitrosopumilus ureiphilus]|uniref:Universal stress protein n=1 Tax=Nitrosopumilus ureiphilus TaxID=1470067 RepID=A0A7D5M5G1_9ARCH|nr:universal stress protein [Nitrosopumilus ureiphilus]QLH07072.1 universal stress protein [Nitrosopumilus ureiphilus]
MANYKKILVPLDGSKRSNYVLTEAINIAKRNDADVVALYVLPFSPLSYRDMKVAQETMYKEAKENLAKLKESIKKNGVDVQTKILKGHPGKLITNFANQKKNAIDLIVIGSRDLSGVKEMFLGSVSNYVVHKSKVSTLVVK